MPGIAPTPVDHPVGRFDTRQLVGRQSQLSLGLQVTALPWTAPRLPAEVSAALAMLMVIDSSLTIRTWVGYAVPLGWSLVVATHGLEGKSEVWVFGGSVSGARARPGFG